MTTPLSETAFRDAVGSLVDTARQLATATRTLDTVRALHRPVKHFDELDLSTFTACSCTPGLAFTDCATARAVNPALTPKGPKP